MCPILLFSVLRRFVRPRGKGPTARLSRAHMARVSRFLLPSLTSSAARGSPLLAGRLSLPFGTSYCRKVTVSSHKRASFVVKFWWTEAWTVVSTRIRRTKRVLEPGAPKGCAGAVAEHTGGGEAEGSSPKRPSLPGIFSREREGPSAAAMAPRASG
jgi:hypothetical protein